MSKKLWFLFAGLSLLILFLGFGFLYLNRLQEQSEIFAEGDIPLKVGILHSMTGTMAASEKPVVDATVMAIEEINAKGGILGKKIEFVVVDGGSTEEGFVKGAKDLLFKERVSAVFGCWTSESRIAVKPLFEKYKNLLFYPVQYEGGESSSSIVYMGATANQQIVPGTTWSLRNLGLKYFLVGSDYVFPIEANKIIKQVAAALDGELVGEEYIPLGSDDVASIIEKIQKAQPDIIFNTLNGSSNVAFFSLLRKAGVTSDIIPTMSFSLGANDFKEFDLPKTSKDYTCWSYYQSLENEKNRAFVKAFQARYGHDSLISDPMVCAYSAIYLWAQTVEELATAEPLKIAHGIKGQVFLSPEGVIYVEPNNNHLWKRARIGMIREDGGTEIMWDSEKPLRPRPYLFFEVL